MKLKIVSLDDVDGTILTELGRKFKEIFGFEVIVGDKIPIAKEAYSRKRNQYNATRLLKCLLNMQYNDEFKVIALIDYDIYIDGLNFVFGVADVSTGVALVSVKRLREEFYNRPCNENLFYSRLLKEAVHELGHLSGMTHCLNNRCVMHFSNSLHDTDIKDMNFCVMCRPKLIK